MANLSNINNYFVVDTTGKVAIGDVSAATIPTLLTQLTLYDNTATASLVIQSGAASGKKYELGSSSTGKFQITDLDAGLDRLTVATNGRIGIGTSNPVALLVLSQANGANIRFENQTTSRVCTVGEGVGTNDVFSFRGNSYRSTDTLSVVFSTDRVGIGIITPNEKLQVAGNIHAYAPNGIDAGLFASTAAGNTTAAVRSSGVTHFNGGNVGIGTTTPGANLEVKTLSGGSGAATLRLNTNFGSGNAVDINPFISGINNGGMEIKLAGTQRLIILPSGNVGIGTNTPGDAKLYVNGGTTLAGTNNDSDGAIRMYGDRKLPQATHFVKRNYKLTAGSSDALYSIARQWHDHANWGLGNINVIMWGIYFGKNNFSKADFSCRYGYSGGAADVVANFNPGSIAIPSWTAATQVSGNIHYRDLQITVPAYWQISFEIISPGCAQTYNVNNTAHNTVYLYPH